MIIRAKILLICTNTVNTTNNNYNMNINYINNDYEKDIMIILILVAVL